jgi:hypothetical protein
MAQIIINIPDDKKDWIIDGAAIDLRWEDIVANPAYDDMVVPHPIDNPPTIPNPESKAVFIKKTMIYWLKKAAMRGNSQAVQLANEQEAFNIDIT